MDIIENFDRAAPAYEISAAPQAALAEALADWVLPGERHGLALEFGAGTGLFTRCMVPWMGAYLATDAAPNMVARGVCACRAVAWAVRDAADPGGLGPADWLFACNLLQWLTDPAAVLARWREEAAPYCELVVAVLTQGTLGELQSLLPGTAPLPWRDGEAWADLVTAAGFAITRNATWHQTARYPSALALLRNVHQMGLAPRPVVGAGRLRAALREYDDRFRAPGGGVYASWHAWMARATAV